MAWYDAATDHVTVLTKTIYDSLMTYVRDHSTEHITGGVDAIPVATETKTGLCPILSGDETEFLDGSGNWATPPATVTEVTGTAPIVSSGGTTPAISITAATTGAPGAMSAADKTKLDAIEALADVTDATNVAAAGALMTTCTVATTLGTDDTTLPTSKAVKTVTDALVTKATYNAYTVLAADSDDTPAALTVGASTIVGRKSSGGIVALSKTEAQTVLNVADGANAYVHPNHSGDVTSVADGAQTIADAAVSLAKMANLAQDKIIGRSTASTGVPEAITCTAAGRALLDDTTAADQCTTLGLGTMAVETATDYVANALYNAETVIIAISDDTPEPLTIGEQTLLGRITGGDVTALTPTQIRTMLNVAEGAGAGTVTGVTGTAPIVSTEGTAPVISISAASAGAAGSMSLDHYSKLEAIEAAADVTDATNVDAAGAVMEGDYAAYSILAADTVDTPAALELAASTIPARLSSGGIVAATMAEISAELPQRTRSLVLSAASAIQPGSDSAELIQTELATNLFPLPRGVFTFAGRTDERLCWVTSVEDNWDFDTMTAQVSFTAPTQEDAAVSFLLYCMGVDDGESLTLEPTLVATLSGSLSTDAAYTLHKSAVSDAFEIPGSGTGQEILWMVKRAATDTYTGDAEFIAVKLLYGVT